jgi:hypothetical protein
MRKVARLLNGGVELREGVVVAAIGLVTLRLQPGELVGAPFFLNRHRADSTPSR